MVKVSLSISIAGIAENQIFVINSDVGGSVEMTFKGIEPIYRSCVVPLLVEVLKQ